MRTLLIITYIFFATPLLVSAQKIDSLFMDAAIRKLRNSKEYTLKVANLMPENKYSFKPNPEEMNFGEQILHIASNLGWLSSSFLKSSTNPISKSEILNKPDLINKLTLAYNFSLNVLEHFDRRQLSDTVSFFAGPMNKLQIINLINDHQTHHRGQLLVYLRLNGIKPPDYIGW